MSREATSVKGRRFGKLKVIGRADIKGGAGKQAQWACRCDCGNITITGGGMLLGGSKKGCKNCESATRSASKTTHGHSKGDNGKPTREYNSYCNAKRRCKQPNHHHYKYYGGRGIEFRFTSFQQFYSLLGPRPKGKTLDRINNDGHYEPGNVRWATGEEQQANKGHNDR